MTDCDFRARRIRPCRPLKGLTFFSQIWLLCHKTQHSLTHSPDPVDDEADEDDDNNNNESSKGPSNADEFPALETAMDWYEQQSEFCPTQLLLLKRESETLQRNNEDLQWYSEK
ncbi:hypothetical protein TNCV_2112351 [Trichonephila clavipes]|nr:hypothetical protein TNCV_2112351 [Trichonephila clavipes]